MKICFFNSIEQIGRKAWNDCFPDELERFDHFLALEKSELPDFSWGYLILSQNEKTIAAVSLFFTEYSLETTVQGYYKNILISLKKLFPSLLTLKLICLGSPETEHCYLGFHPSIKESEKPRLLKKLLGAFEKKAKELGYSLLAIKDVPETLKPLWDQIASKRGFKSMTSLPTGILKIEFSSIEEYLKKLSYSTRKDIRRKMRKFKDLRVELKNNIDDVIGPMMEMYQDTKNRSEWTFEDLTEKYFSGALELMKECSLCVLYYAGEQPIGFNLLYLDQRRMIDKFFCMNSAIGRKFNLYFLSWMTNVKLCIEKGIKCYQSGQVGYENKIRLGSYLLPNWIYFKHRNPLINAILRLLSPIFEVDNKSLLNDFQKHELPE
ncbi:MAG: GNAT family N-acetyltransferase [Candidatus Riflebacteria bacterium]|nr:GNAT family N-acetyltransferase [Candidatus Riflebacteria bacterium]